MGHAESPTLLLSEGGSRYNDGGRKAADNDCQAITHFHPPRGTLVGVFVLPRCPTGYHIMCDVQALMRRPLQFYLIAFRIMEIDRGTGSFRTVAFDGFADRYPEPRELSDDGVTIEGLHAEAEMIRAYLKRLGGGHATLIRAREQVRAGVAAFEPQEKGVAALSVAVKTKLDPKGIFNPGRMG